MQLDLNRKYEAERGFARSVERYVKLDICQLSGIPDGSFDVVVAFGGPFSYVFERREDAAASCRRVLHSGGVLLASVMSNLGPLLVELRAQPDRWQALLDIEAQAAARPGFIDGGTHLLVAAAAS